MHGAKTSSNVTEKWRSVRKHAAEKRANLSCTAGNVPAVILKSFPALRRKTSSGAPCRSRRQLPADSSIQFAGFTTADDVAIGIKRIDTIA